MKGKIDFPRFCQVKTPSINTNCLLNKEKPNQLYIDSAMKGETREETKTNLILNDSIRQLKCTMFPFIMIIFADFN